MGFYARHLLPRIIDFVMKNEEMTRLRAAWVPQACGDVLEVGIGSGLNLPFYSSDARRIYAVDPSLELQRMARKRAAAVPIRVEFLSQSAEDRLPLDEGSVDTVLVTWALCSIQDPIKALGELRRLLKPGGRLLFVEHGRAPDAGVARWQDRITPFWKRIGGGCHLNRKMDELIGTAGFRIRELRTCYLTGPRPLTYTYQGVAEVR